MKAMKYFDPSSKNAGAEADVKVHGCGHLSCLLRSDWNSTSVLKTKGVVERILTMVMLCSDNDSYGVQKYRIASATMSKWGLHALFCIPEFKAKLDGDVPKGKNFWSDLQGWMDDAFGGILQAMQRHRTYLGLQLWEYRLLWSLYVQSL